MEVSGFEPLTLCLQSRCSPSWAIPPLSWWVWEDLNFRPHAYQACALTTWATNPYLFQYRLATTAIKGYVDSITSAHQSLFFERRWSSRRFPYGYLVTTSPSLKNLDSNITKHYILIQALFGWCDGRCVQGAGTYSPRNSDTRLLHIPASWERVTVLNPNYD